MLHAARRLHAWLICDVRQNRTSHPMIRKFLLLCLIIVPAVALRAASDGAPTPIESERGKFDQPPTSISVPNPRYPFEMRLKGIEGGVVVEFTVTADGLVGDAKAVQATHKEFLGAALHAIKDARFKPAQKDGRPVPVRMRATLVFRLDTPSQN